MNPALLAAAMAIGGPVMLPTPPPSPPSKIVSHVTLMTGPDRARSRGQNYGYLNHEERRAQRSRTRRGLR